MSLRKLAAADLKTLTRTASERASHAHHELLALRRAVDEAISAVDTALSAVAPADEEIDALTDKIGTAADAEVDSATARVRAEGERALEDAIVAARIESERAVEKAVQAARADAQRTADETLAAARADAARALDEAVKAAHATFAVQIKSEQDRSAAIAEELKQANEALSQALAETAATKEDAERRVKDLQHALVKAEAARADQVKGVRARTVKVALEPIEHLRAAFQRLTTAKSTDEVLAILLEALGTEFSRVALFDVTANCIEGRRHIGFDAEGGISKILVPLNVHSPLTDAVRTGRVQGLPARELTDPAHVLFGGTPTFVLALPVPVRGRVIAVIYADDCDQADAEFITPERRVKFAEVLLWHAIPLLTRLSIEAEATAELREYAASVVRDLESVYTVDAASHKGAELRGRLRENLEYARQRFAERVEAEEPLAASLLDEEIGKAVSAKRSAPFARDLAAVAAVASPAREGNAARAGASQRA